MKFTNYRGNLNPRESEELLERLDALLAEYDVFHHNVRSVYWDPQFKVFHDFHESVTRLYNTLRADMELIAELIQQYGANPSAVDLSETELQRVGEVYDFEEATQLIVQDADILIAILAEFEIFVKGHGLSDLHGLVQKGLDQLNLVVWHFTNIRSALLN